MTLLASSLKMRASLPQQPRCDAAKCSGRLARGRASVAAWRVSRRACVVRTRASPSALPTPPKGQMLVRV